jgi:hypothetical protein
MLSPAGARSPDERSALVSPIMAGCTAREGGRVEGRRCCVVGTRDLSRLDHLTVNQTMVAASQRDRIAYRLLGRCDPNASDGAAAV